MHLDVDQAQPLSTGAHVKRHIVQPRSQPILCKHRVISLAVYAGLEPSSGLARPRHRWRGRNISTISLQAHDRCLICATTRRAQAGDLGTRCGLQNAEKSLDGDNARVAQLTAALAKATGAKQDSLDDQLAQAKVQAELDQDEVDNAKQELTRAGAADCNAYRYASE